MIQPLKVSRTIAIVMGLNVFLFPDHQNNLLASPGGVEVAVLLGYRKSQQSFEVLLFHWSLTMFVFEPADNHKN
jgi:hypothetical protein